MENSVLLKGTRSLSLFLFALCLFKLNKGRRLSPSRWVSWQEKGKQEARQEGLGIKSRKEQFCFLYFLSVSLQTAEPGKHAVVVEKIKFSRLRGRVHRQRENIIMVAACGCVFMLLSLYSYKELDSGQFPSLNNSAWVLRFLYMCVCVAIFYFDIFSPQVQISHKIAVDRPQKWNSDLTSTQYSGLKSALLTGWFFKFELPSLPVSSSSSWSSSSSVLCL